MAQVTFRTPAGEFRSTVVETAVAAGPLSLSCVAVGGLALGFLFWYAVAIRTHVSAAGADLALWLALVAGLALAFGSWYAYAAYFARHTHVSMLTALRWDAPSWLLLTTVALGFVLPPSIINPGRGAAIAIGLFALAKTFIAARFEHTIRDVLIAFVVTRLGIIVTAELAAGMIAQRAGEHVAESTNTFLAVWSRWDAVHYLDIARTGYYGFDMAFFPLYPLLIHIVGKFTGNMLIAGLLISNVALFFGLAFFHRLVEHQYNRAVAQRAVFYISIFPTAVFFSAVYSEALFFALTVASFYFIREHKWLAAGVLGGLAALTRSEGVLLFVPYVMEVLTPFSGSLERLRDDIPRTARIVAGAALIPLGLFAYMAWLWVLRGDPLYFSHVQTHWNRHLAPPWVSIWHAFRQIAVSHNAAAISTQTIELAFTALMIAVLAAGWTRLRPSYLAYMTLSILVPLCTSSLMSMPRFALVLFPMFVVLALWGGRSWVNSLIVAFSLPLLGLFTVLFATWYWVA